jgi:hypothetical protein
LNVLIEGCGERSGGKAGSGTASRRSGTAHNLMEHGRYEEAAAHAARCGAERSRYSARMVQGLFDEAAGIRLTGESNRPAHREVALIATGRWQEAAALLESRAGRARIERLAADQREMAEVAVLQERCLAELLRHHGGDAGAASRLRTLAAGPHGRHCMAALSEIVPLDEGRQLLDDASAALLEMAGAGKDWAPFEWEILVAPLRWAAGLPDVPRQPGDEGRWSIRAELQLAEPESWNNLIWTYAWLAPEAAAHLPTDAAPAARASVLEWSTASHVLDGDIAAARNSARQAALEAPGLEVPEDRLYLAVLPAVVALYSTETDLEFDFDRDGMKSGVACDDRLRVGPCWHKQLSRLLLRRGDPIDPRRDDGFAGSPVEPLAAAQRGDGRALMQTIGGWFDGAVMAILPRITSGRQEVITQLVWGASLEDSFSAWEDEQHYPWSAAIHAFRRRALLRVAGASSEAERWDAIYRRFDAVFSDRRRLVPLIMCVLIDGHRRDLGNDIIPE